MMSYQTGSLGMMTAGSAQSVSTQGAPGLFGGYPAPTTEVQVLTDTHLHDQFAAGRVPLHHDDFACGTTSVLRSETEAMALGENDVVFARVCGGGGVGDPLARTAARVATDVADGWVSPQSALEIYGVVIAEDGTLDEAETAARRDRLHLERKTWTPAAHRWPGAISNQIAPVAAASLAPSPRSAPAIRRSSPHPAPRPGAPGPAG